MKVKINNIDEFCEALKAGYKITDINGVHIVSLGKSINLYGIGFAFDFPDMYYEKPDLVKIECGKHYETRDGRKACVCFYNAKEKYPFAGLIEEVSGAVTWAENGLVCKNETNALDLVSEWKEDK